MRKTKANTTEPLPFRCPQVAILFTYDVTAPRCQLVPGSHQWRLRSRSETVDTHTLPNSSPFDSTCDEFTRKNMRPASYSQHRR